MEIIRQYAFSDIAAFFCGSETLAVRDVLFDVQLQDHDGMVILTPRFQMSFRMEIVPLIAIESNKDTVRLSTRLPKLYSVFLWMYCSFLLMHQLFSLFYAISRNATISLRLFLPALFLILFAFAGFILFRWRFRVFLHEFDAILHDALEA